MAFTLGKLGIPIVNNMSNIEFLLDKLIKQIFESFDVCDLMEKFSIKEVEEGIKKLIDLRNKLLEFLLKFKNFLVKIKSLLDILEPISKILKIIPPILKALPIPNLYTTTGITTIFSDLLAFIKDIIDTISSIVSVLGNIVDNLIKKIEEYTKILDKIDLSITSCAYKFSDKKLKNINEFLLLSIKPNRTSQENEKLNNLKKQSVKNTLSLLNTIPPLDLAIPVENYKGFTFIIKVKKTLQDIEQKYAVALDSRQIAILEGNPSYSSNEKILIDELKFIIDSQNLSGF